MAFPGEAKIGEGIVKYIKLGPSKSSFYIWMKKAGPPLTLPALSIPGIFFCYFILLRVPAIPNSPKPKSSIVVGSGMVFMNSSEGSFPSNVILY